MFRRLPDIHAQQIRFSVDGKEFSAAAGDTVAAAMLSSGVVTCRKSAVTGADRAPYCLMGVCFECLVTIDGVGNRQACLIAVEEGMQVRTQSGLRNVVSEAGEGGDRA